MAKRPSSKSKPSASGGGKAVRVAIFHGPESFLRQKHTDDLRRELEEAGRGLDIVRFDGLTAPIGDILDPSAVPAPADGAPTDMETAPY